MSTNREILGFRAKLAAGERLVGTFIKTPTPHMVEIAALSSLDFVVLDAEHAPYDPPALDLSIMAGRAAGLDVLVRIPTATSYWMQQALDLGAAGVVVPQIQSTQAAQAMARAARFEDGDRGYSNSPRAGEYGTTDMPTYIRNADGGAAVIIQIENPQAVDNVKEIAAVPGVDALFIGRADLAVAYGASDVAAPEIEAIARKIEDAASANNLPVAGFYANAQAYRAQGSKGVSMIVLGSDQLMLKSAWAAAAEDARAQ